MGKVQNLQLSIFGDYISIKPNTDLFIQLLSALREEQFIPGSVDIANIDIKTGRLAIDHRVQLLSLNKVWSITFFDNRIDFNYNYQEGTEAYPGIKPIVLRGKELIQKTFGPIPDTVGNRLAVNCRIFLEHMTSEELKRFFDRFSKTLEAAKDNDYAEWSVRYNIRDNLLVGEDRSELCNRIIEMGQIERPIINQDKVENVKDIVITLDVNTDALNNRNRFKYQNLLLFSDQATAFIAKTVEEIEAN